MIAHAVPDPASPTRLSMSKKLTIYVFALLLCGRSLRSLASGQQTRSHAEKETQLLMLPSQAEPIAAGGESEASIALLAFLLLRDDIIVSSEC